MAVITNTEYTVEVGAFMFSIVLLWMIIFYSRIFTVTIEK